MSTLIISCWTISEGKRVALMLVSFAMIFVSMLVLVSIQYMRNDLLPTGCTPEGCRRCRKDCPTKATLDTQSGGEKR